MGRFAVVLWLLLITAAAFFATLFNFWTIAGWLRLMGVPEQQHLLWQIACSQLELYFWWRFFGWGPKMLREADVVQQLINAFQTEGFPDEIRGLAEHAKRLVQQGWDIVRHQILKQSEGHGDGRLQRWSARIRKSFAPVGYTMIYLLGSWPTVNVIVGTPLCRIVQPQLRFALPVLMLGNINTVIANTVLLGLLIWLWEDHFTLLMGLAAGSLTVWLVIRRVRASRP